MIRFYIYNLFLLLSTSLLSAQNIAPQAVNSAGSKMTQSVGSLSFTVGELVIQQLYDSLGNSLGGGFTNSSTISTTVLSIQEPDANLLQVSVFPNPVAELLQIKIKESVLSEMTIELTDLNGKALYFGHYQLMNQNIGISVVNYPPGVYFLTLKTMSSRILGTYKIIKK